MSKYKSKQYITESKFEFYCQTGQLYEGFVVGVGYAFVTVTVAENPFASPNKASASFQKSVFVQDIDQTKLARNMSLGKILNPKWGKNVEFAKDIRERNILLLSENADILDIIPNDKAIDESFNDENHIFLNHRIYQEIISLFDGDKTKYYSLLLQQTHISRDIASQPNEGEIWREGMPTVYGSGEKYLVVHKKSGRYVELMSRQLKREFDEKYERTLPDVYRKHYSSPIDDLSFAIGLFSAFGAACSPISKSAPYLSILRPDENLKGMADAARKEVHKHRKKLIPKRIDWYSKYDIIYPPKY